MSMTPSQRHPICQLCGARHGDGDCSGPRICSGPRVLRDVKLVEWGPDLIGFTDMAAQAGDDDP
jgi:hypothetical protein